MKTMLITHQCFSWCWVVLTLVKTFPASQAPLGAQEAGTGGGTAKRADSNWPKGYSISCDIMPSILIGGKMAGEGSSRGLETNGVGRQVVSSCITCLDVCSSLVPRVHLSLSPSCHFLFHCY